VNTNGPIVDLSVPYGQIVNPIDTTTSSLGGNLPANAPVGEVVQTAIRMFDQQGVGHDVSYTFTKNATDDWTLDVAIDGTSVALDAVGMEDVTFNPDGSMNTPAAPSIVSFTPDPATYPGWPGPVSIDLSAIGQFGGSSTVQATGQDGFALGSLQSFTLGNDGTITGVYSNGMRQPLGQLALASFNNPSGLEKAGNSSFRVGDNSGAAMVGLAGVAGRGVLNSGALEMSNVDLAEEFTGLIVAQRGFQANSRVITASDEILQDLVNLKR
jgi:flagellar hook protein FlgE